MKIKQLFLMGFFLMVFANSINAQTSQTIFNNIDGLNVKVDFTTEPDSLHKPYKDVYLKIDVTGNNPNHWIVVTDQNQTTIDSNYISSSDLADNREIYYISLKDIKSNVLEKFNFQILNNKNKIVFSKIFYVLAEKNAPSDFTIKKAYFDGNAPKDAPIVSTSAQNLITAKNGPDLFTQSVVVNDKKELILTIINYGDLPVNINKAKIYNDFQTNNQNFKNQLIGTVDISGGIVSAGARKTIKLTNLFRMPTGKKYYHIRLYSYDPKTNVNNFVLGTTSILNF